MGMIMAVEIIKATHVGFVSGRFGSEISETSVPHFSHLKCSYPLVGPQVSSLPPQYSQWFNSANTSLRFFTRLPLRPLNHHHASNHDSQSLLFPLHVGDASRCCFSMALIVSKEELRLGLTSCSPLTPHNLHFQPILTTLRSSPFLCFLSYSEDAGTVRGDISADAVFRYDPAALVYLVEVAAASAGSDFPVFFVLVFPLSTQGLVPPNDDFLRPL